VSEAELHGKLNLPGRAGVSGRRTGGRNLPEGVVGGTGKCAVGLAEIGVIENVEDVAARFQHQPLGELRLFNQREILILEAGTDDDVASEVAEGGANGQLRPGPHAGQYCGLPLNAEPMPMGTGPVTLGRIVFADPV
jgi:hypothetical protein